MAGAEEGVSHIYRVRQKKRSRVVAKAGFDSKDLLP